MVDDLYLRTRAQKIIILKFYEESRAPLGFFKPRSRQNCLSLSLLLPHPSNKELKGRMYVKKGVYLLMLYFADFLPIIKCIYYRDHRSCILNIIFRAILSGQNSIHHLLPDSCQSNNLNLHLIDTLPT